MTALERVRLAAEQQASEEEAHEHLMKQCPWYRNVSEEKNCAHDPGEHCKTATVKLTPRTPEASTVPKPTRPPGGPGLFHIKGRELPPYIQHLWHHLKDEYGPEKAYRVAVGVVEKWAKGIHPGGRKGKGGKQGRVHPDVQAAAAKNVAQWEQDRADAHRQSREHERGKVKATVALAGKHVPGFSGQGWHSQETMEVVRWLFANPRVLHKAVALARKYPHNPHTVADTLHEQLVPRSVLSGMLRAGSDPVKIDWLEIAHEIIERRADPVKLAASGDSFPGEAKIALPPVPAGKVPKSMYTAHRVNDTLLHLAHAAERLNQAKASRAMRGYHMIHVNNHLSSAIREMHNLVASVRKNYPAEARELDALSRTIGLAKSVTPDVKAATFAHLLETVLYQQAHAKRHAAVMLNPDPDAVWRFNYDHLHSHLKGALEHAYKLAKHLDDNYPDEARWLNDLARIEDPNDPYMGLAAPGTITAPGAKPQYGLYQHPSQTVSPSPPTPPDVKLPTAAEIRKLIGQVPDCIDASLSQSARNHLDAAAVKLAKDDPIAALTVLRIAQSDIYACHKADLGMAMPAVYTANIFARVPPAEQSSANTAMIRSKDREMAWRKLERQVAVAIDKIRRKHFHGAFPAGMQDARFSAGPGSESSLEKVVRLASAD